jgi:hypothetical protein
VRVLSCERVQSLLSLYGDGELDVTTRLQVRAHLDDCLSCRDDAEVFETIGSALRSQAAERLEAAREEVTRMHNGVIARMSNEGQPLGRRVARSLDDLHLLWVAAAATTAAVFCVAVALGVGRLTLHEVPHSMSAVIGAMATPGSNQNPVSIDGRLLLPRASGGLVVPASMGRGDDGLYPLSAVVTREGEVRNVSLLLSEAELGVSTDVSAILNAASRMRFEPARAAGGSPVAVNVVWLLAHTTVIGSQDGDAIQIPRMRDLPSRPRVGVPISQLHPARLRVVA